MSTRPLLRRFWILTALTSLSSFAVHAQSGASLSPARTYHTDKYGRQTRVVKERWNENSRGEKNGTYLEYDEHGALIKRLHYVNNVLNGEMMVVEDNSLLVLGVPVRNVSVVTGKFVNGEAEGVVIQRRYANGVAGKYLRASFFRNGVETARDAYVDGVRYEHATLLDGKRNGPAKIYGATVNEYASGNYENDKPHGTWSNAVAVEDGVGYEKGEDDGMSTSINRVKKFKIKYKKGSEVVFYNGVPVSPEDIPGMH